MRKRGTWRRSSGLAAISGLRTGMGPALFLLGQRRRTRWLGPGLLMAAAELIIDKFPRVPPRTSPAGLAGRAVSGGLMSLLARPRGGSAVGALLLGAGVAVAAACVGLRGRLLLTRLLGGGARANAAAGAIEDACALAAGRSFARAR